MATRQQPQRAARNQQTVLPTASKEEEVKFGKSSEWGREQLKWLGVDFIVNQPRIDLNLHVLRVKESDWSPELRARTSS